MLFSNTKTITLTLLVSAVLANAHIHPPNHANLKRLIKKRAPLPQDDTLTVTPVAGAGAAVPIFSSTASASATTSAAASVSQSSESATLTASDSLTSSLSSSVSILSDLSSSSSASLNTSSLISSASTTSTVPTSTAAPANTAAPTDVTQNSNPTTKSKSVVTLTQSVDATPTTSVTPEAAAAASAPKSTAITALIIVAASVAAIAILWTVFRKWKFGRSSKFDERLQPIDWRPTADDDEPLPGGHRRRHSGASSFRSAGHLPSANGHGSSDHGHNSPSSYTLPDHDFTAGPAHLAPVGGYADLARGPSPQPQMTQARGTANLGRPGYDVGVPLHHQGYGV